MIRRFSASLIAGALAVPSAHAQDPAANHQTAEYALGMIRGPSESTPSPRSNTGAPDPAMRSVSHTVRLGLAGIQVTYHASLSYAVPAMRVDVMRRIRMSRAGAEEGCLWRRLSGRSRW